MRAIAFDLGASSGRAILGTLEAGRLTLEELHRFANTPVQLPTGLYWDTLRLFHEIRHGLTVAGRVSWNLDALLHDMFGHRQVWLNSPSNWPRGPRVITTVGGALCCSAYYVFTFATASGSTFTTVRPKKPPGAHIGVSGGETPLTIRGAYIYCGNRNWLYEHWGEGPANWQLSCHR